MFRSLRRYIFIIFALLLVNIASARVREKTVALGFEAGSLIDVNIKYHRTEFIAWEFYASLYPQKWYIAGYGWKAHITNLFESEPGIYFYYGPEVYLYIAEKGEHPFFGFAAGSSKFGAALLGSAGFSYFPDEIPLELYANIGLGLNSNPELKLLAKLVFGIRFKIAG